jgi:2-oxo-4-hydroxy-4-carboxy-5-ureidoimidazoline decarboxylase
MLNLDQLNHLPKTQAYTELLRCCGSKSWAEKMVFQLPFREKEELFAFAKRSWETLAPQDCFEAFHYLSNSMNGDESSGKWKSAQQAYIHKFGFSFILDTEETSLEKILETLNTRLAHEPTLEYEIANGEAFKLILKKIRNHIR